MKSHHPLRAPRRYRLSFINESTLNRVWTIGMSRRRLILYVAAIAAAIALIGASLISFTPLKQLLPGYLKPAQRQEYIEASRRLDSIVDRARTTDAYLYNLSNILSDNINSDSLLLVPPPPIMPENTDSMLAPSSAEVAYVERYIAEYGFDLQASDPGDNGIPIFHSPVADATVSRGSTPETTRIRLTQPRNPIMAIENGVVIDISTSSSGLSTCILQHPGGYLSRYAGLDETFFKAGQKVSAGQRIGLIKNTANSLLPFDFAIYRDGQRLQPLDYVPF